MAEAKGFFTDVSSLATMHINMERYDDPITREEVKNAEKQLLKLFLAPKLTILQVLGSFRSGMKLEGVSLALSRTSGLVASSPIETRALLIAAALEDIAYLEGRTAVEDALREVGLNRVSADPYVNQMRKKTSSYRGFVQMALIPATVTPPAHRR